MKSSSCFLMYSSKLQIGLQGLPAATVFDGMSLLTMLPAPMIQLSPMVTFGNITLLQPMKQFLPTCIGPYITVSLFWFGKFRITLVAASWVTNAQSKEIVVLSPIVIRYGSEPKLACPTMLTFFPRLGVPYLSLGINTFFFINTYLSAI